jgi:hypothetical protein
VGETGITLISGLVAYVRFVWQSLMNGAPMFTPRVGVELPSSLLYLGEAVMAGYPEVSIAWTRLFAELVGESKSSVTRDFWNLRFH